MTLVLGAFVDGFGASPQAHHQRMTLEAGQIFRIDNGPTASGNHLAGARFQLGKRFAFQSAKGSFAFGGEDLRNGNTRALLNQRISVHEFKPQILGG
tara:strand:+ start:567 stop:857 length:291 start_codon:yes stop_codon:yes gene_type:complete